MTYLIPLQKRGASAAYEDNVLWSEGNVFVMDNHRLALWCWFQKMKKAQRYNLLHIDAHPDLNESALAHFNDDLWTMELEDFRHVRQPDINVPLFRWDNYLQIFLQKYPEQVGKTVSATHHLGSSQELSEEIRDFHLVKFCDSLFHGKQYINDLSWIVNLDLDYFFSAAPQKAVLYSDDYINYLSSAIKSGLNNSMIAILTISLSPECCGSWEKAEALLLKFGYRL